MSKCLSKITSAILIIAFLMSDIVWAYPYGQADKFAAQHLAPPSFFIEDVEAHYKVYAKTIEQLIEHNDVVDTRNMLLESLARILDNNKDKLKELSSELDWQNGGPDYNIVREKGAIVEILVPVSPQYTIRYHDPDRTDAEREKKYAPLAVNSLSLNRYLQKQLLATPDAKFAKNVEKNQTPAQTQIIHRKFKYPVGKPTTNVSLKIAESLDRGYALTNGRVPILYADNGILVFTYHNLMDIIRDPTWEAVMKNIVTGKKRFQRRFKIARLLQLADHYDIEFFGLKGGSAYGLMRLLKKLSAEHEELRLAELAQYYVANAVRIDPSDDSYLAMGNSVFQNNLSNRLSVEPTDREKFILQIRDAVSKLGPEAAKPNVAKEVGYNQTRYFDARCRRNNIDAAMLYNRLGVVSSEFTKERFMARMRNAVNNLKLKHILPFVQNVAIEAGYYSKPSFYNTLSRKGVSNIEAIACGVYIYPENKEEMLALIRRAVKDIEGEAALPEVAKRCGYDHRGNFLNRLKELGISIDMLYDDLGVKKGPLIEEPEEFKLKLADTAALLGEGAWIKKVMENMGYANLNMLHRVLERYSVNKDTLFTEYGIKYGKDFEKHKLLGRIRAIVSACARTRMPDLDYIAKKLNLKSAERLLEILNKLDIDEIALYSEYGARPKFKTDADMDRILRKAISKLGGKINVADVSSLIGFKYPFLFLEECGRRNVDRTKLRKRYDILDEHEEKNKKEKMEFVAKLKGVIADLGEDAIFNRVTEKMGFAQPSGLYKRAYHFGLTAEYIRSLGMKPKKRGANNKASEKTPANRFSSSGEYEEQKPMPRKPSDIPVLAPPSSPEEERELFARFRDASGAEKKRLLDLLCGMNMKLVISVAEGLSSVVFAGIIEREDLIGEGIVGLIQAIKEFDLERKTKFSTCAVPKIRGAMLHILRSKYSHRPRFQQELLMDIKRYIKTMGEDIPASEIAGILDIEESEVEALLADQTGILLSLDAERGTEDEGYTLLDKVEDHSGGADVENNVVESLFKQGLLNTLLELSILNTRDCKVLEMYYIKGMTQDEIAAELRVAHSRPGQIIKRAKEKINKAVKDYPDIICALGINIQAEESSVEGEDNRRLSSSVASNLANLTKLDGIMSSVKLAEGARVLLSENLFIKDGDRTELENAKIALASVLGDEYNGPIAILLPERLRLRAINNEAAKDKLAIVMTKEDFEDRRIWNDTDKEASLKASVVVVDDRLVDSNYLYLAGVVALAHAVMANDKETIRAIYKLISGIAIDDEALKLLDDGSGNNVAFALRAILKFKPIIRLDAEVLEREKLRMESLLIAA